MKTKVIGNGRKIITNKEHVKIVNKLEAQIIKLQKTIDHNQIVHNNMIDDLNKATLLLISR